MTNEKIIKELDLVLMGKRIRTKREGMSLTREKLAEKLEVSSKFINDIEVGAKGISVYNLYKLSQILEVSLDYLVTGQTKDISPERAILTQSILESLNKCNRQQLKCMEIITNNFVKGAAFENAGDQDEEGNK